MQSSADPQPDINPAGDRYAREAARSRNRQLHLRRPVPENLSHNANDRAAAPSVYEQSRMLGQADARIVAMAIAPALAGG